MMLKDQEALASRPRQSDQAHVMTIKAHHHIQVVGASNALLCNRVMIRASSRKGHINSVMLATQSTQSDLSSTKEAQEENALRGDGLAQSFYMHTPQQQQALLQLTFLPSCRPPFTKL